MVHIDHPVPLAMDHRRQFMHPLPVIGVVIGILLDPLPPRRDQPVLDLLQTAARNHNVEIADKPPRACPQASGRIDSPLQQQHRLPQRFGSPIGFP